MTAPVRTMDWDQIKNQLEFLNRLAIQDLLDVLNVVSSMSPTEGTLYLLDAMPVLIDTYGGTALENSREWWDSLFEDVETPPTITPELPSAEQITAQTRWGVAPLYTGTGDVAMRLSSVLQQSIFGAQRNTVAENSRLLNVRYARFARPGACAFCRVLASRGAVYGSSARALFVGATGSTAHYSDGSARGRRIQQGRVRGVQQAGAKYHDHCKCVVGPEVEHIDLNLPDYYDRFNDEYLKARELLSKDGSADGASMSDITKAMRQLGFGA